MSCYASKLIAIAEAEVGYLEKKSNSNVNSKTDNAGDKNYTKYAADLDKISGFYNGRKNGYAWCSVFVDWCMVKAFGEINAKKITFHTFYGASCTLSAKQYMRVGRWFNTPAIGDEIFFGTVDDCTHTGIVYKVDNTYVYTIEGNTSSASGVVANGGAVEKKKYELNYSKIAGYGRPKYDAEPKPEKNTKKDVCKVDLSILRKGDKGENVRGLQILLKGRGYNCGSADGDFGSKTYNAVIEYQKAKKLDVDGEVGSQTWGSLLGA